jgi:hypothetical protein
LNSQNSDIEHLYDEGASEILLSTQNDTRQKDIIEAFEGTSGLNSRHTQKKLDDGAVVYEPYKETMNISFTNIKN